MAHGTVMPAAGTTPVRLAHGQRSSLTSPLPRMGRRAAVRVASARHSEGTDNHGEAGNVIGLQRLLKASATTGALTLLVAQAALAVPTQQNAMAAFAPASAHTVSLARTAEPVVGDLAANSLLEAVRGTKDSATTELANKLPQSAPAASESQTPAAATPKDTGSGSEPSVVEPTPGGTSNSSPVSMLTPAHQVRPIALTAETPSKALGKAAGGGNPDQKKKLASRGAPDAPTPGASAANTSGVDESGTSYEEKTKNLILLSRKGRPADFAEWTN